MTQPAQPQQPQIPGLITASGVTPTPVPATPAPAIQQPAVSAAVQAAPADVAPQPVAQPPVPAQPVALPTAMQPAVSYAVTTTTSGIPGLANPTATTATVPGLNPPAPAAPVPVPAPPAQPPAATPPQEPATGTEPDRGYPQGTPLEQMTGDQREAYWRYHSRQWENRAKERADYDALKTKAGQYDQLVASQATDQEKAVAAARAEGERLATARAAVVLVDAHVRAGLQARLQPHQVEALATNLNHQHFLGPDGLSVDAARVATFVETVAPQPAAPAVTAPAVPAVPGALPVGVPQTPQPAAAPVTGLPRALPDLGQGAQTGAPLDKLEAGRQQARAFLANGGNR